VIYFNCAHRWASAISLDQKIHSHRDRGVAMNDRQIKMPAKKKTAIREEEDVEIVSQRQKPDVGRYLLPLDRQTKGSFHTSEDAQAAALEIKKAFPVLQVSIYDRVTSSHTLVKVS
jgi:hypothetical protein